MAKRRTFIADLNTPAGARIATAEEAHAWNSAIRAGEALIRAHARDTNESFTAERPEVYGPIAGPASVYTRSWIGDRTGTRLIVRMAEVHS